MSAKAVPDGFNTVSAYLVVPDANKAMDFYEKAFGAKRGAVMNGPDGGVMHAEMQIGNSTVMLTQENPAWEQKSAATYGGSPVSMHMYVDDADALFNQAVEAGCSVTFPMSDVFWGDRYGKVTDVFGLSWGIATHKEDLSEEEMGKRAAEYFANMQG